MTAIILIVKHCVGVIMDYNSIYLLLADDLRLKVHVNNNWELRVSWNASKYESLAPLRGWNYKVHRQHKI